jgi:N-acetylglucosamine kinase-like BadF-type ATPase
MIPGRVALRGRASAAVGIVLAAGVGGIVLAVIERGNP